MRNYTGRSSGKVIGYVLVALVVVPAAVFGLRHWLKISRAVLQEEMVGVWTLTEGPRSGPPGPMDSWLAGLTNQWVALGSKGTCWYHTLSGISPWLGTANAEQLRQFGETLTPFDWVGGPASAAQQTPDEPGRRKPREITRPVLTWRYKAPDGRGAHLGLAEILISRDGKLDGSMTLESTRDRNGQALLRMLVKPDGASHYIFLRKSDAKDIDAPAT